MMLASHVFPIVWFIFMMLELVGTSFGQSVGADMANRLKQNTVSVRVGDRSGFGFIVGQRDGRLYMVTAWHVVFGVDKEHPSTERLKPQVLLYQQEARDAKIEAMSSAEYDLAVLSVPFPRGFQWIKECLAETDKGKRGTAVWFIGKNQDWFVPVSPGHINQVRPTKPQVASIEGLSVSPGSSGAPVIADTGLVGMIMQDDSNESRALMVDYIQRAFQEWNYPWDLRMNPVLTSDGHKPQTSPLQMTNNSIIYVVDSCEVEPSGAFLQCHGSITNTKPFNWQIILLLQQRGGLRNTKLDPLGKTNAVDENANQYIASSIRLANSASPATGQFEYQLQSGLRTPIEIVFGHFDQSAKKLHNLEIRGLGSDNRPIVVTFKDIPIAFMNGQHTGQN